MIVFFTGENDVHAERLTERVRDAGVEAQVIDTALFPITMGISGFGTSSLSDCYWYLPNSVISAKKIKVAWYRKKRIPTVSTELTSEAALLAEEESQAAIHNLWSQLECLWVNHPYTLPYSENKLNQLKLARQSGITVPDTLVTNNPADARKFYEMYEGNVIIKPFRRSWFTVGDDAKETDLSIYTNRVNQEHLEFIDDIKYCPSILQEYVPKKYELRITILFDEFFACRIDSQSSARTRDDWRKYDIENTPHSFVDLPAELVGKLQHFISELGINHGAIDMVVTPDDKYVFLEVNPSGQWLWLEELTGFPLTNRLAARLLAIYNCGVE